MRSAPKASPMMISERIVSHSVSSTPAFSAPTAILTTSSLCGDGRIELQTSSISSDRIRSTVRRSWSQPAGRSSFSAAWEKGR